MPQMKSIACIASKEKALPVGNRTRTFNLPVGPTTMSWAESGTGSQLGGWSLAI